MSIDELPLKLSRDDLASQYFDSLPFEPYAVQQEALLAWFTAEQGVLVCAPTGMGKTLIAEAALFEALHTGKRAYYTTPLIALTDQKFQEIQDAAVRWGFSADKIGLVTGNRRLNADAPVLVVVAEILFNRLQHSEMFDFSDVSAVVMDEFHSFNDPERGIVWEFSLGLLPQHVRLLLLSATVGNAFEFVQWLKHSHQRDVVLVQSTERRVPLTIEWVGDQLLDEQLEAMAEGEDPNRRIPTLVFCFNREECWNVAELLKGKRLLVEGQQKRLATELSVFDWSEGAGPKLKQILQRGVGVHHAGILPKYRRLVEDLFQRKLLSVCVCTETLAAGINLPARSVVVPNLLKGPPGKKRLIEASGAQQMFGRAGRPQFDTAGFVYGMAHEDDVKILRWKQKFDQIPENTKDPGLLKARKALKRKMPTRRATEQYWTEQQFLKLCQAPPAKLYSRGAVPWRLLAHMLDASPEVDRVRRLVSKRLMDSKHLENAQRTLDRMLLTLWRAGYVTLEPEPPKDEPSEKPVVQEIQKKPLIASTQFVDSREKEQVEGPPIYRAEFARPTPSLRNLMQLRGVNPLYGMFLVNQLGIADRNERLQAFESILELPGSVGHFVRVPPHDEMPPGPLASTRLDMQLLKLGLVTLEQLGQVAPKEEEKPTALFEEERVFVLTLAEKLRILFEYDFPGVPDVVISPVWAAGELLEFGDFNKFVTSNRMQKQEGILFRHVLRMILLTREFSQLCPPETTEDEWKTDLRDIADRLTEVCRRVDPSSTDQVLEQVTEDLM